MHDSLLLCRLCFNTSDNLIDIIETLDTGSFPLKRLSWKIFKTLNIEILPDDKVRKICSECLNVLNKYYAFREKAIKMNQLFKDISTILNPDTPNDQLTILLNRFMKESLSSSESCPEGSCNKNLLTTVDSERNSTLHKSVVNIDEHDKNLVFQDDIDSNVNNNTSPEHLTQEQELKSQQNNDIGNREISSDIENEDVATLTANGNIIGDVSLMEPSTSENIMEHVFSETNPLTWNDKDDVTGTIELLDCDEIEYNENDIFEIDYEALAKEYAEAVRNIQLEKIKNKENVEEQDVASVIHRVKGEESEKLKICLSIKIEDFVMRRIERERKLSLEKEEPNCLQVDTTKSIKKQVTGKIKKCLKLKTICTLCRTPFKTTEKLKSHINITHPVMEECNDTLYSMQINNSTKVLVNYETARSWKLYTTPRVYLENVPLQRQHDKKRRTIDSKKNLFDTKLFSSDKNNEEFRGKIQSIKPFVINKSETNNFLQIKRQL